MLNWSTKFPTLKRLFGEAQAAWLVKESEQAVLEIDAFCKQHHIDAQLSLKGVYYGNKSRASGQHATCRR